MKGGKAAMADKEYLEREALLKKFTDDENQDNKAVGIGEFLFAVIRGIIENQPAADVVEVVRCKDCKHWNNGDCYRLELSMPNDFCSYGAKMDGRGDGECD